MPQYDPWQNVFVDRLASVVKRTTSTDRSVSRWTTLQYRAYGQEKEVTAQDRDKFATYLRDGVTGLDYAQQR